MKCAKDRQDNGCRDAFKINRAIGRAPPLLGYDHDDERPCLRGTKAAALPRNCIAFAETVHQPGFPSPRYCARRTGSKTALAASRAIATRWHPGCERMPDSSVGRAAAILCSSLDYASHLRDLGSGWRSKQATVFAAKLRWTFVAHAVTRGGSVDAFGQHQAASLVQP